MQTLCIYVEPSISFQTLFVHAFRIVRNSWKFSMLLLYTLWDDWPIFMISGSNEQLQQELKYTLLKPDCHSWWISKMQSGREDTLEERYVRCGRSEEVNTRELICQRVRVRVTMLRFEGCSGRNSVGRVQHSSNRLSGISTRTMQQSTTSSLSQTIWPIWASRQLFSLPIVQTLLPVTFAYSLSSR